MPPTVVDLFAGAGGFSLGFAQAGADVIGAVELDEWAADTYLTNHPHSKVLVADIQSLSDQQILSAFTPTPTILLGGPPCQGFSICRKNAGDPKNPRNSLFTEFIRAAKLLGPSIVIMENVPNLVKAKTASGEPVLQIILEELQALGYSTAHAILEATDYGIPQIRKRLFIVASSSPLAQPFPAPAYTVIDKRQKPLFRTTGLSPCPTLWDAISDLPDIAAREGTEQTEHDKPPQNEYQRLLRANCQVLHNHVAMKHSRRMIERFAAMACGDSVSDVPHRLRPLERNGQGRISTKVYDQNNRRMHPHKPCHTIPASFYANFVHPFKNRNFTAREGARIQSFPDSFIFKGKPTVVSQKLLKREGRDSERHLCQYNQIGNAVPPLLAKALATNILSQLKGDPHESPRRQPHAEREPSYQIS
jgi:DNA (cytosine-5)-methyltransferase 1